ncbi:hypothetical protein D3C72_1453550 [compost metagenome]
MLLIAIACLDSLFLAPCLPAGGISAGIVQFDAVHRAHGQAQFAARAGLGNDGVHALVGAQNGVRGADLDAQGAADAPVFIDAGEHARSFYAMVRIQRQCGAAGDGCQARDAFLSARRALVDGCCAHSHGLGVASAVGVAAARALGLR